MRARLLLMLPLFAASLGCGSHDTAAPPPPQSATTPTPAAPAAGRSCESSLASVASQLRTQPLALDVPARPALVLPRVRSAAHVEDTAPIVSIGADGTLGLDGRVADAASIAQDLETLDRNWSMLHGGASSPGIVLVAADHGRTLADVVALHHALGDARRLRFLVGIGEASPGTPCPTSAGALCSRPERGSGDARELAAPFRESCPGFSTALLAIDGADLAARPRLLAGAIDDLPSTPPCPCDGLDLPLLRYAAVRLSGGLDAPLGVVDVPADGDATRTIDAVVGATP